MYLRQSYPASKPNNSFKPNLLRYSKSVAEKACHAFASTTQVGLTQALGGIMKFHHGLAFLAIFGAPIIIGIAVAFEAGFRQMSFGKLVSAVVVSMVLSLLVVTPIAITCSKSRDVELAASKLLTTQEIKTLQGTDLFCPTVFRFDRDGYKTCLVSDNDGGANVGCG